VETGINVLEIGEALVCCKSAELIFAIGIDTVVVMFFMSGERAGDDEFALREIASMCERVISPELIRSAIVVEESTCRAKRHGSIRRE